MNKIEIITQPSQPSVEISEEETMHKLQELVLQNPSPSHVEEDDKDDDQKEEHKHHNEEHHKHHNEEHHKHVHNSNGADDKKETPKSPNPTAQLSKEYSKKHPKNSKSSKEHAKTTTDEKIEASSSSETSSGSESDEEAEYDEDGFEIPPGKIPLDGHFSTEEVQHLIEIAQKEGFLKEDVAVKVVERNKLIGDKIVLIEDDKKKNYTHKSELTDKEENKADTED